MRYYRYKNTDKNINNALKEQYLTLTKDEKRTVRREKMWRRCGSVVAMIFFFSCMVASVYLLTLIPYPSNAWLQVLAVIGKVVTGLILLVVSGLLTFGITYPIWKKAESFHIPQMKKEICSKE